MMNFALGVISEFSEFLFRTDGKTLSGCKIISSAISTAIFGGFQSPNKSNKWEKLR